ncbi:histidine phosphatase family protein [Amycolatopsis thermophila]|uniref:Phosphoglycerate mutase n=1 Tax=Amycolatopsis thermophila TaxID=206084 RepID=A0ABU0ELT2_9PSEU|nr:histidine phosphatase family protein [Amycolatopsis thermophila]MDQ0376187.1 putative phosphoglycerate mutase [Amycolatopsis thermophila]
MALHLVRHGQSEWNVAGRVQGQSPRAGGLTALGREQAAAVRVNGTAIVTSDLPRARETASIIARRLGLPVLVEAGLREQRLGALEGRRFADVQPVIDGLWADPRRPPPGGGESIADLHRRVHRALARLAARHPREELIVVTHGGPVRVATTAADPVLGEAVPRDAVGNATVITVHPGAPV